MTSCSRVQNVDAKGVWVGVQFVQYDDAYEEDSDAEEAATDDSDYHEAQDSDRDSEDADFKSAAARIERQAKRDRAAEGGGGGGGSGAPRSSGGKSAKGGGSGRRRNAKKEGRESELDEDEQGEVEDLIVCPFPTPPPLICTPVAQTPAYRIHTKHAELLHMFHTLPCNLSMNITPHRGTPTSASATKPLIDTTHTLHRMMGR